MMAVFDLLRRIWRSKRVRIVVTSLLVGIVAGVVQLGMPLEDFLLDVRTVVRREEAPKTITVVAIDDASLQAFDSVDVPRSADAVLIRKLFEKGARRVFFDRTFDFQGNPEGDQELVKTLKAFEGRVFFGASHADTDMPEEMLSSVPNRKFRDHVGVTAIIAKVNPFELSFFYPFKYQTSLGEVPSLSAKLANLDELPDGWFRPDFAIDARSVPTVSYIDVIDGSADAQQISGHDIVVGPTAILMKDNYLMPFQGTVGGVYFHVIAAHTLKKGVPIRLGWLPAMALVAGVIVTGMRRGQSFDRYRIAGLAATLLFLPLALDHYAIEIEVFPAALAAGIAIFRARALDQVEEAVEYNAESGLPSLQSLRNVEQGLNGSLVAMKVRNYGAIVGSFSDPVEATLASEIVRRIQLGEPGAKVYHEGDTFFWLSELVNPVDLLEHLEGLHHLLQKGVCVRGRDIDLSFNCGVETDPGRPLANRISSAMQAAEQAVRDDELVSHYESGKQDAHWDISLMSSLDRAIDNGEVWVAYQPKLDLASGRIKGAEALVRWTHPERGPISPEQFIRIAEEYHRIERITQFVLNEAARFTSALLRSGKEFSVSVNISAQLLRNPGLPNMIFDVLKAHRLPPRNLVLEITETDRLDRSSKTFEMMQSLVESGLQLSIDDFGTGNATIDYLRIMPASEVKIDKTFVSELETSKEDYFLVQSIIEMAHSLDRRVVAEGVENQRILEILNDLHCDQVQGYHIGLPVPKEELVPIIESGVVKKFG